MGTGTSRHRDVRSGWAALRLFRVRAYRRSGYWRKMPPSCSKLCWSLDRSGLSGRQQPEAGPFFARALAQLNPAQVHGLAVGAVGIGLA